MTNRLFPAGWLKGLRVRSATEFYLVFVALVLPWQKHQVGRKSVTTFHVINGVLVLGILISLMIKGPKPRWYLAIPIYVYLLGSVLGMFSSEVYAINVYTLIQDVYLYSWFVVMCVLLDTKDKIRLLVFAWMIALVLVLGTEGFWAGSTGRGEFSFRNPNRAAAYLTLSFFFLLHPSVPLLVKGLLGVLVVKAVGATGSAAGSLGIGLGFGAFLWAIAYAKSAKEIRPLLLLGVVTLGLIVVVVNPLANRDLPTVLGEMAPTAAPRIERSADTREEIWAKGMESFWAHPLGIGPASFHKQIDSGVSDDGMIELHSDFVASLVERGIVGFLGFLMLLAMMIGNVFRMLNRSFAWRDVIWSAALTGAAATYFFYCITHEALHHETFWLMLAMIMSHLNILQRGSIRDDTGFSGVPREVEIETMVAGAW